MKFSKQKFLSSMALAFAALSAGAASVQEKPGFVKVEWSEKGGERWTVEGMADREAGLPMTTNTFFAICSNTKPLASVLTLTFVEEGVLNLDDPVAKYFPEFADIKVKGRPPKRPVTLRHLITHTAGFASFQVRNPGVRTDMTPFRDQVRLAAEQGLITEPGETYRYCNIGFSVMGAILEKVTGRKVPELMQERIFDPLGMTGATFYPDEKTIAQTAVPYYYPPKGGAPLRYDFSNRYTVPLGNRARTPLLSSGVVCTVGDYLRFSQMMALKGVGANGRRILSEKTFNEYLLQRQTPPGDKVDSSFDVGFNKDHSGGSKGGLFATGAEWNWSKRSCVVTFRAKSPYAPAGKKSELDASGFGGKPTTFAVSDVKAAGGKVTCRVRNNEDRHGVGTVRLTVNGAVAGERRMALAIGEAKTLSFDYAVKEDDRVEVVPVVVGSDYIPEPQPVKSAIEITALYYPGTEHMPEWDMVDQTLPQIKPLLGWYDEGNPEVIDWQIKWAVEHGITSFCVDWYWNKGEQRLDHWVKAFYKARFRKYLKWYLMYANHNAPGSHSTEDMTRLAHWWIDHYFTTPEYYTIDGKPVVVMWDTPKLDSDFIDEAAKKGEKLATGEGTKRAFAIVEDLAKKAGLKGVYWIDMYHGWKYVQKKVDFAKGIGCEAQMIYNFDGLAYYMAEKDRKPTDTPQHFSYDLVKAAVPKWWEMTSRDPEFPFWPMIPTGWNDLPRSFQRARAIVDRTPEKFYEVCCACREFCEKRGFKRVVIAPVNEWQEGSYIEPNEEYGFGMYDALRDAFCEKPAAGWPKNLRPEEVGRGPYDYPKMHYSPVQSWTFDRTPEGWYRQPYGCQVTLCKNGALWFLTSRRDNFQIRQRLVPFAAEKYKSFRLRMKVELNPTFGMGKGLDNLPRMRLKWGTAERPIIRKDLSVDFGNAVANAEVIADGDWHEYSLDLAGHADWKGQVNELWFEAINAEHAIVSIDWMKFDEKPADRMDVIAIYYPHWHAYPKGDEWFHKGFNEWEFCQDAKTRFCGHKAPLRPLFGYIDETKPEEVEKEIALAANAGITVFMFDWYWYDGQMTMQEALEQGFLKAKNRDRMKFCLMWCYHDRVDSFRDDPRKPKRMLMPLARTEDEFLGCVRYATEHFFREPNHYQRDGKPLFAVYRANAFVKDRGGVAETRVLLEKAQAIARAAGLKGICFEAMNPQDAKAAKELADAGFDLLGSYNRVPHSAELSRRAQEGDPLYDYEAEMLPHHEKTWATLRDATPLAYVPVVTAGRDSSMRCSNDEPFPWKTLRYPYGSIATNNNPNAFERMVRGARNAAANDPKKPNAISIYGWNEYTEGGYIAPNDHDGDGALRAVAAVFGRHPAGEYTFVDPASKQVMTVPAPAFANVAYGTDAKQKMDVWLPETDGGVTPCEVLFSKDAIVTAKTAERIRACLSHGTAVVSVGLGTDQDVEKAKKTIATLACRWNIDRERISYER